jgi:hypothetical protein
MSESVLAPSIQGPRRLHFEWVLPALFAPRKAFSEIASRNRGVWLTPLLILTLTGLLLALGAGPIKQQIALSGGLPLPPDFQYWGPDQQAQFIKAAEATQNPVFFFVFPGISALGSVWVGWLLVSGLLHLVLTILGGTGNSTLSLNLVAWSALPLALRDLVRAGAMFFSGSLLDTPGLAGFARVGEGFALFLVKFLALIDIYIIWHLALLVIGLRQANGITIRKAFGGALFTILLILIVQASIGYLAGMFSDLSITRPFYF